MVIPTETLFDLLDLYTEHRTATIVGRDHDLNTFLDIRIVLNSEVSANQYPRYTQSKMKKAVSNDKKNPATYATRDYCGSGPKYVANLRKEASNKFQYQHSSPPAKNSMQFQTTGTVRYVLNPERAKSEKRAMADFFGFAEENESEVEARRSVERRGKQGEKRRGERGEAGDGERVRGQCGERGRERYGEQGRGPGRRA